MNKHKKIISIVLLSVVFVLLILAALTYIPRTRKLDYDMYGYIINRDGQIIEEFTFQITGKEYDFIIDPPGGEISFSGDTLKKIQEDAFILHFDWNSDTISKNYTSGSYIGYDRSSGSRYVMGTLSYYSGIANRSHFEYGMLDLEDSTFCMYADDLVNGAYIVGVTDPNADPMAAVKAYQEHAGVPNTQPAPEN